LVAATVGRGVVGLAAAGRGVVGFGVVEEGTGVAAVGFFDLAGFAGLCCFFGFGPLPGLSPDGPRLGTGTGMEGSARGFVGCGSDDAVRVGTGTTAE
jgi:hypothetical protein